MIIFEYVISHVLIYSQSQNSMEDRSFKISSENIFYNRVIKRCIKFLYSLKYCLIENNINRYFKISLSLISMI